MRGGEMYEPVGGFDFSDDYGDDAMLAVLDDIDPLLDLAPPAKRCRSASDWLDSLVGQELPMKPPFPNGVGSINGIPFEEGMPLFQPATFMSTPGFVEPSHRQLQSAPVLQTAEPPLQNPSPMFGMDQWKESSRDSQFWKQQLAMLTQTDATDAAGPTTSLPTDAGPTSETGSGSGAGCGSFAETARLPLTTSFADSDSARCGTSDKWQSNVHPGNSSLGPGSVVEGTASCDCTVTAQVQREWRDSAACLPTGPRVHPERLSGENETRFTGGFGTSVGAVPVQKRKERSVRVGEKEEDRHPRHPPPHHPHHRSRQQEQVEQKPTAGPLLKVMTETSEQQHRGDVLARRLAEALGVEYVPPPVQLPPLPAPHLLRDVESSSFDRQACEGAGQLAVGRPGPNGWLRIELVRFAEAIATDDQASAREGMERLTQVADPSGEPSSRVAYYFLEALWAKSSGTGLTRWTLPLLSPLQEYIDCMTEVSQHMPYRQFVTECANSAFLDATYGEDAIHILDLGWWHAAQWPSFMRSLAARPGPLPTLRITRVEPPPGNAPPAVPRFNLGDFDVKLSRAAAAVGIRFEFRQIECRLESLKSAMLNRTPGEALLVNGALRLHTSPDRSVVRSSPRDAALRAIHALNPRLLFLGERVVDQNIPFFMRRFTEVLDYYSAAFDSLDAGMPRDSAGRLTFEKNVLGRDITNAIACEGLQRVVRCEPVEKWEKRLKEAAFVAVPPGGDALGDMRNLLTRKFHAGFQICQEKYTLYLTWKGKKMIASSSWRPAC